MTSLPRILLAAAITPLFLSLARCAPESQLDQCAVAAGNGGSASMSTSSRYVDLGGSSADSLVSGVYQCGLQPGRLEPCDLRPHGRGVGICHRPAVDQSRSL
jgi:hypothetical protein